MPRAALAFLAFLFTVSPLIAELRTGWSGYLNASGRVAPESGAGELGDSRLLGRLLNDSNWFTLQVAASDTTTLAGTSVVARVDGSTLYSADESAGNFSGYQLTQLYLVTGIAGPWSLRAGTLWQNIGYSSLYDLYIGQVFWRTYGLSLKNESGRLNFVLGVGDSGYGLLAEDAYRESPSRAGYTPVPTTGGFISLDTESAGQIQLGGEVYFEGSGHNRNRPKTSDNYSYADYQAGLPATHGTTQTTPVEHFKLVLNHSFKFNGGQQFMTVAFTRLPPLLLTPVGGGVVHTTTLTDERYRLQVADEFTWNADPKHLAFIFGAVADLTWDGDHPQPTRYGAWGTLIRSQVYWTEKFHSLIELSFLRQRKTGNTKAFNVYQIKPGFVFSPAGRGLFARPVVRLMFGSQYDPKKRRPWHHLVSFEFEHWWHGV